MEFLWPFVKVICRRLKGPGLQFLSQIFEKA
jgi:hypothetical protein